MFYHLCKLVITSTSLLYPAYASYKVLRLPQASPEQREGMERWLMFWCVMGGVWVWEEVGEWSVGWFPFYYEFKTLVILWLALPQIQGSTYVYLNHLSPFLTSHESDIDAFLSNLRSSAMTLGADYLRRALVAARNAVLGQALAADPAQPPPVQAEPAVGGAAATPQASSLAQLAGGLVRQYGPAALAAGQALLHPTAAATAKAAGAAGTRERTASTSSEKRRRELEEELARLDREDGSGSGSGSDSATSSGFSEHLTASGAKVRSRTPSSLSPGTAGGSSGSSSSPQDPVAQRVLHSLVGSQYEEITHADVDGRATGDGGRRKSGGGWFGWGGQEEGKGGKEA
ncbi:hypothetical protein JCM8097_003662 [Rhodosporidiobolus ruineniae]